MHQHFIRYVGVQSDINKNLFPKNISELKIDSSRVTGSVIALDFIAKQMGLYDLLGEEAPIIMALVFCHCHDYRSVVKVQRWFKKTDLEKVLGIGEINENRLRKAILALENIDQLSLQKSIFENLMKLSNEKPSTVVYDVTNTYFSGKCAVIGKMGHDKEGVRGRKLIQIGLIVTQKHGFPIFHQIHPGNINDSKIFSEAIIHLKQFGINDGVIVFDRGITSKDNIFQLSKENWKIIGGISSHRGIKNIFSKMDFSNLESYRNRVVQGESIFYVLTIKYKFGKTLGKLAILYNPSKKQAQKENRIQKIVEAQQDFLNKKVINSSIKKFLTKTGKVNSHAIKREEKLDGFSFIFTNGKFSRQEIVKLYFEKDIIEKSFQSLKGVLSLHPIRMWLEESINAHVTICYLGYSLLTTFRYFLRKSEGKNEFFNISVEDALDELSDVYKIYFHKESLLKNNSDENTQLNKLVTLNKKQELILKAISPKLLL